MPEASPRTDAPIRHRSSAVARMLRMPVATLRVWERRYGVTQPELTPSGQRLYSADDVRRLALLKQLIDRGHAIGRLAPLDMAQLQQVASTHASLLAARAVPPPADAVAPGPVTVALVGEALAERLQRPALRRALARPIQWLGPFADAAQAAAALQGRAVDLLLVHAPRLHENEPAPTHLPTAVIYRFASEPTCARLAEAGVHLLHEPPHDAALGQWLNGLLQAQSGTPLPAAEVSAPTARRWDDAALADFAGLSSTIACECPRHVAELLMQLSHFEAYSAECRQRSAADGALHAYLQQVAANARARFEEALEHVARHEGLTLPPR